MLCQSAVVEGILLRGDAAHEQREKAPERRPLRGEVNAQRAAVHLQHVMGPGAPGAGMQAGGAALLDLQEQCKVKGDIINLVPLEGWHALQHE